MSPVSPVLRRLEQGARALVETLPPPAQRRLRSVAGRSGPRQVPLGALDEELSTAAALFATSEDAARAHLDGFELVPPDGCPSDPFSGEYTRWVWELYAAISGRSGYSTDHEASPFDLATALARPFPYSTGSAAVVGEDLEGRAFVLRALGTGRAPGGPLASAGRRGAGVLPPARLVEFGPGWGNLTGDLLATGYVVTAVEVDPGFCELLRARAPAGSRLEVRQVDMLSYVPEEPADAAVFFESFHHCADHRRMLTRLHDVVAPGGVVLFAGEPVQAMPYPWGPRLDGLSLWSTRTYGWLELGFAPAYFGEALRRAGWSAERFSSRSNPKADVFVARRSARPEGDGREGRRSPA